MKSGLTQENQIEKDLVLLINSISSTILPGKDVGTGPTGKLSTILQERISEAGRVALQYNEVNIAESICIFLGKARLNSQRAYILNEYNRAELLIKKSGSVIDKNGMRLNSTQMKMQEIKRRKEALEILERTMITNKKLDDPELIYEGAILIWNISLPFLNPIYNSFVYKSFEIASSSLEYIQSNDHGLRVNFHLELAKLELQKDQALKAEPHIRKALALDYSKPLDQIEDMEAGEAKSLYQRTYDRILYSLKEKIRLKLTNNPETDIERVILSSTRS